MSGGLEHVDAGETWGGNLLFRGKGGQVDRRTVISVLGSGLLGVRLSSGVARYLPRMLTRTIPSSGESLPVIGVGTCRTFDVGSDARRRAELEQVLATLVESGGSVVDSSPMYGSSERVAGDLAGKLSLRPRLFLATKVWTSGREAGIRQMETSFGRLRTQRVDLMQIHNLVDWRTHVPTLRTWKERGRIRYWGITHYTAGAHAELERVMGSERPDFVQVNLSLGEREALNRVVPAAGEHGAAVLVNRPFGGGELLGGLRNRPLPGWAVEVGCTEWSQLLLKWVLSFPAVTCVIPGTANPEHMRSNVAAVQGALPDEGMRERIEAAIRGT